MKEQSSRQNEYCLGKRCVGFMLYERVGFKVGMSIVQVRDEQGSGYGRVGFKVGMSIVR